MNAWNNLKFGKPIILGAYIGPAGSYTPTHQDQHSTIAVNICIPIDDLNINPENVAVWTFFKPNENQLVGLIHFYSILFFFIFFFNFFKFFNFNFFFFKKIIKLKGYAASIDRVRNEKQ